MSSSIRLCYVLGSLAILFPASAHAVQFTYLEGTEIIGVANALATSLFPETNGPQSASVTDATFTTGPHIHYGYASSETALAENGTFARAFADSKGFYFDTHFFFEIYVGAYTYLPYGTDTGSASATASQRVTFQVDTTGIYRLSGYFAFGGNTGAAGSLSFSNGYHIEDHLVPPVSGAAEPFEQLFSLQAGSSYELFAEAAPELQANMILQGTFAFVEAPEPSTACLLALGACGAVRGRRRGAVLRR